MRHQRHSTLVARFCCRYLRNHSLDSEMTSVPLPWSQKVEDQLHANSLHPLLDCLPNRRRVLLRHLPF